jgi:ATP-dependent RNA helicase RhlE
VSETYVQCIERTARAGCDGRAIAFCAVHEMAQLKVIEKVLSTRVETAGGVPWGGMDEPPQGPATASAPFLCDGARSTRSLCPRLLRESDGRRGTTNERPMAGREGR